MADKLTALKADFRIFLAYVWKKLHLPPPTSIQNDIAHYLQTGDTRCIIEAFRGVGKSWITSAFVCWLLLRDPQLKILVVSASKERADSFSTFTKRLINELPVLHHLKASAGQRDSNVAFDVGPARAAHAPSVKSVGITGQLTGSRADVIIADDVETPGNSLTQLMRERLAELVKEFASILSPKGRIIYLGTPQCEMSLYNQLPGRGYDMRVWPARIPTEKKLKNYGDTLAPYIHKLIENGAKQLTPTDPDRFDDLILIEKEAEYARSGFELQFMLDTTLSDENRYPLKMSDLIVCDLNTDIAPSKITWASDVENVLDDIPCVGLIGDRIHKPMYIDKEDWSAYTGSIMAIDPSGRGKDRTTYAVIKIKNAMLYLVEQGGFEGGYDSLTLDSLALIAKKHSINEVVIEDNFGDGMFTELIKPYFKKHHRVRIEEVHHSIQKERRIIDTLEPLLNQHRLVVDKSLILEDQKIEDPQHQLFYQLTRITRDKGALKHDDSIDVLAIAVARWSEAMARDNEEASDKEKAKAEDNMVKDFLKEFKINKQTNHWRARR